MLKKCKEHIVEMKRQFKEIYANLLKNVCIFQEKFVPLYRKNKYSNNGKPDAKAKSQRHGQETMNKITFKDAQSYEDIEAAVTAALKYDKVVNDDAAAEQWFKDAGMEGDVHHNVIVSTNVNVWDDEHQGEETYSVIVKEHYIDSGSDDYVYSYYIA